MAELVIGRPDELNAKAKVQRQAPGRFIVVLGEEGISGEAVVVVGHATTAQSHHRGAQQEVLKVLHRERGAGNEEHQRIADNVKDSAKAGVVQLAAEPERVRPACPAQRVFHDEGIRECQLTGAGERAKRKTPELKAVDSQAAAGLDNAQLCGGNRVLAQQVVTDDVNAEAELVRQTIVEDVGLGDAAETSAQWNREREIQIVRGRRAAGLNLEGISAERLKPLGVGPEEAPRQAVLIPAEMAVPVHHELILSEFPDSGERQRAGIRVTETVEPRSARNGGEEEGTTELVALRVQKLHRHRV